MEKEFEASPNLAKVLGTDILSIPSPKRPFGAAPSKKVPVWSWPQLQQNYKLSSEVTSINKNLLNGSDQQAKKKQEAISMNKKVC